MKALRLKYALAMVGVIAAGLAWRSAANPMSPFLHKYGGDALWALLIFLGVRGVFLRATIWRVALLSLTICFAVEFSQLYHAPWIDSLRATRLGGLALGSTFNAPDLLAYLIGVALGCGVELRRERCRAVTGGSSTF